MSRAVIITSYLEYPLDIHGLLQPDDWIVCLDGGYNIAQRLALQPHLLLGDFDSLEGPLPEPEAVSGETEPMGAAGDSLSRDTAEDSLPRDTAEDSLPGDAAGNTPLREHGGVRTGVPEIRRYPPEKDYTDLELAFRTLDPAATPDLLVIGGLGGRLDQTITNIQMLQKYTATPAEWQAQHPENDTDTNLKTDGTVRGSRSDAAAYDATEAIDAPDGNKASFGFFRQYRSIQLMDGRNRCFVIHGSEEAADMRPERLDDATGSRPASSGGTADTQPEIHRIPRVPNCYLSLIPLSEECSGVDLQGVKYPLSNATLLRGVSLSVSNEFLEDQAELRLRRGSLLVITAGGSSSGFQTNWRNG